jgi:hypothetical protein
MRLILSAIVLVWGVLAGGTLTAAENAPEYPCYRLATAPVMNGKADDAGWQQLPEAGAFFIHGGKDYAIEKRTVFRSGWTDDSLYLQVKCFEPLPEKMKASTTDGDPLYADDAIEMFFQSEAGSAYYQLIANSVGARWNAVGPEGKEAKPWKWEVRSGKWEKGWLLEVRIPFAVLGKTPKTGETWPVNIARDNTTGPAVESATCWPPLQKGFHDLERFGRFVFSAAAPVAQEVKKVEAQFNEPFNQYLKEQCAAKIKAAGQTELLAALDNPALAAEANPIKEVLGQLTALSSRADAAPGDMVVMLTTWRNLMDLFSEKAKKLDIPLVNVPLKKLAMKIAARQAKDIKVWVNGKAVTAAAGQWPLVLREGLNVIAMAATADGKTPGLRISIPGQSELESRWRVGAAANDDWLTATFDDRSWKKAELDKDGYLSVPAGAAGNVCFRQNVLWSENYYSGLNCLIPKVREWGFSEKSMENLFHVLYSPVSFPLEEYEFVLDVPKGFSLLDEKYTKDYKDDKGGRLSRRPEKVTTEEVRHDNQPYTRYRFAYESAFVPSGKPNQISLIPILLNEFKGPDKTCKFYFRRMASGNLTELEQTLPVRILPPIDGRMLKKVVIQLYCGTPWRTFSGGRLFPEHFNAVMRQALDAGFNSWFIGAWEGEYGKKVYDKVIERGGSVVLVYNNYPIWGNNLGKNSALGKWMESTSETHARFFNNGQASTGIKNMNMELMFCPSFATQAGAKPFKDAVKSDISLMKNGGTKEYIGFPKASIYWTDFEQGTWWENGHGYTIALTGGGSYCFCDNCKKAFRQYAGLPETADLSDDNIFRNYRSDWRTFRDILMGEVNGIVREACNELGLKYSWYNGIHNKGQSIASKGKIDIFFAGCPGDGTANAEQQKTLDSIMKFYREEVGFSSITGQLFASSYEEGGSINMSGGSTWEKDGFLNPKRLKPQLLRMVASFHGGVDLNTSVERCAGSHYYIGEATRLIAEYEDLFYAGERADQLAVSEQIKYPNLLVLKKGKERLVLLFNEGTQPLRVLLENRELASGQKATIFGVKQVVEQPGKMEVTVEPGDVTVVHIK